MFLRVIVTILALTGLSSSLFAQTVQLQPAVVGDRIVVRYNDRPAHRLFVQLGMSLRQIEDWVIYDHLELKDQTGMIVENMLAKLPANQAGIKWHDIITKVDGKTICSVDEFVTAYESAKGDAVDVEAVAEARAG